MITLLLVCVFFGINVRLYFNFDKMQSVVQIILPFNLTLVTLRLNLFNKTLFYKINKKKDKQIILQKTNKKDKRQFHKITIHSLNYSLILGSSDDCLRGLYLSNFIDFVTNFIKSDMNKYLVIENLNKVVMPDFKDTSSKLILNLVVKKGIIDIIKNIFAKKVKENNEVKYANW